MSLRSAWLIRRAWRPRCGSPISPSISARGHERRHRIDHDHVHRAGAHQHLGDLQRLLAGIGLRNQQILQIDAELAGVAGIERVLGIDEAADAAGLLRLGDDVQGERRLADDSGP